MKRMISIYVAGILCIFQICAAQFDGQFQQDQLNAAIYRDRSNERIYIASYPRSGNTYVRYIIEYFTHLCCITDFPTSGNINRVGHPLQIDSILDVSILKPVMKKKHRLKLTNYPVIYIIRNFKECFYSHYVTHGGEKNAYRAILNALEDENQYFF